MEEAITDLLLGASGLTALVGQRITWATRPQAHALPAVVLHKIDGAPVYSDEGESGLFSARIQIDAWATTYAAARAVSREIMAVLSGYGPDSPATGIEFQGVFAEAEQDSFEEATGGVRLYRVRGDFIIWSAT